MSQLPSKSFSLRIILLIVVVAGIGLFFLLGGYRLLTFEELVRRKDTLIELSDSHPRMARIIFLSAYLVLGIFGLPGSTVLNVTAGVLFDFWIGLFLVILGGTVASALAFLVFRYILRDFVEPRVKSRFPKLQETLEHEGAYFVLAIRLFPVLPYSFTNLVLAISPVPFLTYLGMSLLALLPRYLLYVYAGTHLGDVQDPEDLFSPSLTGSLALLALLPWILKRLMPRVKGWFAKKTQ
jgi:uncharacterized membrane protein YdjX (TVP38/TMEM64 family)